jgi:hypothetical protein
MACCIGFIAPALTYHGRIRIDFLKPSQRLGAPLVASSMPQPLSATRNAT